MTIQDHCFDCRGLMDEHRAREEDIRRMARLLSSLRNMIWSRVSYKSGPHVVVRRDFLISLADEIYECMSPSGDSRPPLPSDSSDEQAGTDGKTPDLTTAPSSSAARLDDDGQVGGAFYSTREVRDAGES